MNLSVPIKPEEPKVVESFFDEQTSCLTIRVAGRFDYNCHKMFKEAFMAEKNATFFKVDLAQVVYLDSSALGLLLLLRGHVGEESPRISLINGNHVVVDILKMANFHRLFDIVE